MLPYTVLVRSMEVQSWQHKRKLDSHHFIRHERRQSFSEWIDTRPLPATRLPRLLTPCSRETDSSELLRTFRNLQYLKK